MTESLVTCPSCGIELKQVSARCPGCDTPLPVAQGRAHPAPPFGSQPDPGLPAAGTLHAGTEGTSPADPAMNGAPAEAAGQRHGGAEPWAHRQYGPGDFRQNQVTPYPGAGYPPYGYGQETVALPVQPPPGGFAPQYGLPSYGTPYGYAAMQTQPFPMDAVRRGSVVLGVLSLVAALSVIGSTWLAWLSVQGLSQTGWEMMVGSGSASGGGTAFSVIETEGGIIFFTGFFTLLLGGLMLAPAVVMFLKHRLGGVMVFVGALLATAVAAINVTMALTRISDAAPGTTVGAGLWLFLGAAVAGLVVGIIGLASG